MVEPRKEFQRTECACEKCALFCHHMPGCLIPGDERAIAEHVEGRALTNAEVTDFGLSHFSASMGARAITRIGIIHIPSIVPRLTETGCVFLKDERCGIHQVAPFGCSHMDDHMPVEEANERSKAAVSAQANGHQRASLYSRLWKALYDAGARAIPLEERRANLNKARIAADAEL